MALFSDTVFGKVIEIKIVPFASLGQINISLPKNVTLIKIKEDNNRKRLGYLLGEIGNIHVEDRIVCSLKKTWNAPYVAHSSYVTELHPATMAIGFGDTLYRKIDQYQIIE